MQWNAQILGVNSLMFLNSNPIGILAISITLGSSECYSLVNVSKHSDSNSHPWPEHSLCTSSSTQWWCFSCARFCDDWLTPLRHSLIICYTLLLSISLLCPWGFFLSLMNTYAVIVIAIMNYLLLVFLHLPEAMENNVLLCGGDMFPGSHCRCLVL